MQESQRWRRKKAITWIGARTGQCWQTKSWASWYCVVNIHYVIWFYVISTCKIPKSSQRWYTAGCLPTINWLESRLLGSTSFALGCAALLGDCIMFGSSTDLVSSWATARDALLAESQTRFSICKGCSPEDFRQRVSWPKGRGWWLVDWFLVLGTAKAKQIVMIARCFTKWRIASVW